MSFNQSSLDDIRRDQSREGSRMADSHGLGGLRVNVRPPVAAVKKATKGHEAFLKALETSGTEIRVEKMSSGDILIGRVKHSDKYTITLQVMHTADDRYTNHVLFKHDISEFSALQMRPDPAGTDEGVTLQ